MSSKSNEKLDTPTDEADDEFKEINEILESKPHSLDMNQNYFHTQQQDDSVGLDSSQNKEAENTKKDPVSNEVESAGLKSDKDKQTRIKRIFKPYRRQSQPLNISVSNLNMISEKEEFESNSQFSESLDIDELDKSVVEFFGLGKKKSTDKTKNIIDVNEIDKK